MRKPTYLRRHGRGNTNMKKTYQTQCEESDDNFRYESNVKYTSDPKMVFIYAVIFILIVELVFYFSDYFGLGSH